jgi:hypothetical protein
LHANNLKQALRPAPVGTTSYRIYSKKAWMKLALAAREYLKVIYATGRVLYRDLVNEN